MTTSGRFRECSRKSVIPRWDQILVRLIVNVPTLGDRGIASRIEELLRAVVLNMAITASSLLHHQELVFLLALESRLMVKTLWKLSRCHSMHLGFNVWKACLVSWLPRLARPAVVF